jgi:hypothetical protein
MDPERRFFLHRAKTGALFRGTGLYRGGRSRVQPARRYRIPSSGDVVTRDVFPSKLDEALLSEIIKSHTNEAPGDPARGIAFGVAAGLVAWAIVFLAGWAYG